MFGGLQTLNFQFMKMALSVKTVMLCTALLTVSLSNFSQTIVGNQKVIKLPTTKSGGYSNALLWLPDDYDTTTKNYPLIIYLHGNGEAGTDINKLLNTGLPQRISKGFKPEAFTPGGKLRKFIVVSPQAPSWSYQYMHIKYMLPEIIKRYRVDTLRIYITGISAGGYGVWTCITDDTSFCKKIAAIAPMSSAGIEAYRIPNLINAAKFKVPVWNICGEQDAFWKIAQSYTQIIDNALPGNDAQLTGLPNVGHSAWNEGYDPEWKRDNKNVYEWMLQFKRKKNPEADSASIKTEQEKNVCHGKKIYINSKGTYINGASFSYSPGDFIVLKANQNPYTYLSLESIHGTATCPVTIINEGGQVSMINGMSLSNCTYVKISGTGSKKDKYGFYIEDKINGGVAIDVYGRSSNIEINNVFVHNKTYGLWVKEEVQCADSLNYPNWIIKNISIHNNLIQKTGQEGMYLGSTNPNGGDRQINCDGRIKAPTPLRLGNIRVYDNIIDSTNRSGIQLSCAAYGNNVIYRNTISNCGYELNANQGNGISLGGYTHARVRNNDINNTYAMGIFVLGSGENHVHNNRINSSGNLGGHIINGMASIMVDTRPTTPVDSTLLIITGNSLGKNTDFGVRVYNTFHSIAKGNLICNNIGSDPSINVVAGVQWSDCSGKPSKNKQNKSEHTTNNQSLNSSVYLYPNPAKSILNIKLNENVTGKMGLNIYDEQQRLVLSKSIYLNNSSSTESLNINSLSAGLYFLQIISEHEKSVVKFVKEN